MIAVDRKTPRLAVDRGAPDQYGRCRVRHVDDREARQSVGHERGIAAHADPPRVLETRESSDAQEP